MRKIIRNKTGHIDAFSMCIGIVFAIALIATVYVISDDGLFPFGGSEDNDISSMDIYNYMNKINTQNDNFKEEILDLKDKIEDHESTDYYVKWTTAESEIDNLQHDRGSYAVFTIVWVCLLFSVLLGLFWYNAFKMELKEKKKSIKEKDEKIKELSDENYEQRRDYDREKRKLTDREKKLKDKMTQIQIKLADEVLKITNKGR